MGVMCWMWWGGGCGRGLRNNVEWFLWRGSLLPLGCVAAPKPAIPFCQLYRVVWFGDCFAVEREQAPSPQVMGWSGYFGAALQPNGGKPPRHRVYGLARYWGCTCPLSREPLTSCAVQGKLPGLRRSSHELSSRLPCRQSRRCVQTPDFDPPHRLDVAQGAAVCLSRHSRRHRSV